MPYDCREIEMILNGGNLFPVNEDAFLTHIASCPRCRKLGELDGPLDDTLRGSLPYPAPEGISEAVMVEIRRDLARPQTSGVQTKIVLALASMLVVIVAMIGYFNRGFLNGAYVSSDKAAGKLWAWLGMIDFPWESVISMFSKAAGSAVVVTSLVAAVSLLWIYSIVQLREITE